MVDLTRRLLLLSSGLGFFSPSFANDDSLRNLALFVARLKGFNFLYFYKLGQERDFSLDDFSFVFEHGFRIARVPFDYRIFFTSLDPVIPNKERFRQLDYLISSAVNLGLHVNLCMHRAPGYCVNPPYESRSLWRDSQPASDFASAWSYIVSRYSSVESSLLSFNLVNEPKRDILESDYLRVMLKVIDIVRSSRSDRVVVLDGLAWGTEEIKSAFALAGVVQGARGYYPMQFTHHNAEWVSEKYRNHNPVWPVYVDGNSIGYQGVLKIFQDKWGQAISKDVPISVGEWGVYNKTPHADTLRYMSDCLNIFKSFGWGWLLWNFQGPFGIVNSDRHDVDYENVGRYRIDVKMLTLLKSFL